MKLSSTVVDSAAIERGEWVDVIPGLTGIRIKARGTNNSDYRKLESQLVRDIPLADRIEGLSSADQDRVTGTLLLETVVLDIDGLTEDDGTPIKYSKDLGKTLFLDPDYRIWRAAGVYAGSVMSERRKSVEAQDVKN